MHEYPIVLDLIKTVGEEAQKRNLHDISQISLVIGELSAVIDESVQMYFELLAENTVCEGAKLRFEHIPARLKCRECGREFDHTKSFDCPECGGESRLIKGSGRDFYIKSIDGE